MHRGVSLHGLHEGVPRRDTFVGRMAPVCEDLGFFRAAQFQSMSSFILPPYLGSSGSLPTDEYLCYFQAMNIFILPSILGYLAVFQPKNFKWSSQSILIVLFLFTLHP